MRINVRNLKKNVSYHELKILEIWSDNQLLKSNPNKKKGELLTEFLNCIFLVKLFCSLLFSQTSRTTDF